MTEVVKSIDLEFGFHGLIVKHVMGHLCGYVGVPCEHPLYEMAYDQCLQGCRPVPASWRTIYADARTIPDFPPLPEIPDSMEDPPWDTWPCGWQGEKHPTPENQFKVHGSVDYGGRGVLGMKPELWYFGFRCDHVGDVIPAAPRNWPDAVYRDEAYVEAQVRSLYDQLRSYVLVRSVSDDLAKPQGGEV